MNTDIRMARQHCQVLLAENAGLDSNVEALMGTIEMLRQLAELEGRPLEIPPMSTDLPPEVIMGAINTIGKRLQEAREAAAKTNNGQGESPKLVVPSTGDTVRIAGGRSC